MNVIRKFIHKNFTFTLRCDMLPYVTIYIYIYVYIYIYICLNQRLVNLISGIYDVNS